MYRSVDTRREHSQRQGHLGESREDLTLSPARGWGEDKQVQAARRPKREDGKGQLTKVVDYIRKGSWGKGSLAPGLGKGRVG